MHRRGIRPAALAGLLLALGLTACASGSTLTAATTTTEPAAFERAEAPPSTFAPADVPTTTVTTATTAASTPPSPPATTGTTATTAVGSLVDQLTVAPEASGAGYDRDLFDHWIDADGDGCHTRCEVLAAERHASLPGLPAGGWLSIYDGYSTDDPSELDVDHVVALAEAWRSGAHGWDPARRRAFANDLDHPDALVAVTAATNRSKSDRDPSSWQPPSRDAWCWYATAWTTTKVRWGLTADEAEVRALRNMLASC